MNLKLDSSGDLEIGRGAARTDGVEYTAQLVGNRLKTIKGDWELNKTIGLPWFTDLLRHSYNLDLIYKWVHKIISTTPNVVSVNNLTLGVDKGNRKLFISFDIKTIYGETTKSVEV